MNKNKSNKKDREIKSNIVGNIIQPNNRVNSQIGSVVSRIPTDSVTSKKQNDKKVIIIAAILIGIIIIGLIIFLIANNNKDVGKDKIKETIYTEAYKELGFIENSKLKKLYCAKQSSTESQVQEKEIFIYYFDGNEVDTSIYHNDIVLSEEYMDYYDVMYDEYQKSLNSDYDYENVDTNIMKGKNEILVTVVTYNKKEVEKKLGIQPFVNYDDAKKIMIDSGYTCE